ncbi:hypothetical protein ACQ4LF_23755, partial [Aeromonas salmonicida]
MGGRFNLVLSLVGILIIQGVNTGILLSGYQPQWNQIVKAMVALAVLVKQSPAPALYRHLRAHETFHKNPYVVFCSKKKKNPF